MNSLKKKKTITQIVTLQTSDYQYLLSQEEYIGIVGGYILHKSFKTFTLHLFSA